MKKTLFFSGCAAIFTVILSMSCNNLFIPAVPTRVVGQFSATPTRTAAIQPTATPTLTYTGYLKGSTWTEAVSAAAFTPRTQHVSLVHNNAMWVLSGSNATTRYNDVYNSTDGVTWTPVNSNAPFAGRYGHSGAVYNNTSAGPYPGEEKMWIIGGYNGSYLSDVWCSADGFTWVTSTASAGFGSRAEHTTVVYNNMMWVIAGGKTGDVRQSDVYNSADGAVWSLVTASAAFGKRKQHTSVVFNNLMWVIGGVTDTSALKNDVWYSSDGITWTLATANAGFAARGGHTSVVYDNKIWVLGGFISGGTKRNDCWYSSDGITWAQAASVIPFSIRAWHSSVVYDNKMWVIAGANTPYLNSVWWSQ